MLGRSRLSLFSAYNVCPIWNAVRTELSWTHYRLYDNLKNR